MANEIRKINGYTLKDEVARTTLETKANIEHDHPKFVTHDEFDNLITNLVTREEIEEKADRDHHHDDLYLKKEEISDLVTKEELENLINCNLQLQEDIFHLQDYVSKLSEDLSSALIIIDELKGQIEEIKKNDSDQIPEPEETEKFLLEYTIESRNTDESILSGDPEYYYFPRMFKTSDIEYDFFNDVTLILDDGTETKDLNVYASSVKKIRILYDRDVYAIKFYHGVSLSTGHGCRIKELLKINISNIRNVVNMFLGCKNLINFNKDDFIFNSYITNLNGMFSDCSALESLDLSDWNISNIISIDSMFKNCTSLKSLNLSKWNTSNITDMGCTFAECTALESIDLSDWDTRNVYVAGSGLGAYIRTFENIPTSVDWNYTGENYKNFTLSDTSTKFNGTFPWNEE